MNSGSGIAIRSAHYEDAGDIATLLADSFAEYRPQYTPSGFAATAISSEQIIDRLSEGPLWVATSDGRIAGAVSVTAKGDSLYLRGMAVLPSARGRRIGELLLEHVEGFAVTKGFRRLLLSTTPFLDRAIRLYESFGFTRTGEGPHDLFGTPLFTMEKILSPKS